MRRTQYLIHLSPENQFFNSLYALRHKLADKNLVSKDSRLDFHTTVLGFYSKSERLGFESRADLESSIIDSLEQLSPSVFFTTVKNVNIYSSKLVLELDSPELKSFHNKVIDKFERFIVLKGYVLPAENPELFRERYAFSLERYSPHLSICNVNSERLPIKYSLSLVGQGFYFDKLILSRKATNSWKNLCDLSIS